MMQDILVFGLVAIAAAYLLWRVVRKSKAGCGCGQGGCCAGKTSATKKLSKNSGMSRESQKGRMARRL